MPVLLVLSTEPAKYLFKRAGQKNRYIIQNKKTTVSFCILSSLCPPILDLDFISLCLRRGLFVERVGKRLALHRNAWIPNYSQGHFQFNVRVITLACCHGFRPKVYSVLILWCSENLNRCIKPGLPSSANRCQRS